MSSSREIYEERINKVIDHLNVHLDEVQSLDSLAEIASFSSYHFHRIFVAVTGETVFNYTDRLRLEKAARLLRFSKNTVAETATDCGYSSPATFSRSFKRYFGSSPSAYRKSGKIENRKIRKELYPVKQHLVPMSYEQKEKEFPVTIKSMPKRPIAFIRVQRSFEEGRVQTAFDQLIAWAKKHGVFKTETFFGMSPDDPKVTPQDLYTYEACMTIPASLSAEIERDIESKVLPENDYATSHVTGSFDRVATAIHYLFNDWLINSPYEPEHLPGQEIFNDNENINNWEHFDLELCIPVRKLQR